MQVLRTWRFEINNRHLRQEASADLGNSEIRMQVQFRRQLNPLLVLTVIHNQMYGSAYLSTTLSGSGSLTLSQVSGIYTAKGDGQFGRVRSFQLPLVRITDALYILFTMDAARRGAVEGPRPR
jgi:hypothetical protein